MFLGRYLIFSETSEDAVFDNSGNYVDGCILQNCNFDGYIDTYGGITYTSSIAIDGASVFIDNCELKNNFNTSAIGIYNGSAKINNNLITQNISVDPCVNGGGIYIEQGNSVIVENNIIQDNSVSYNQDSFCKQDSKGGGGICIYDSSNVRIAYNIISNNNAAGVLNGGGIYIAPNENVIIENNAITDNKTDGQGGGIYLDTGNPFANIKNNKIINNIAKSDGGGIYAFTGIIENNDIIDNTGYNGAGISCGSGSTMQNNTIARNKGRRSISCYNTKIIYNSIMDNDAEINISGTSTFNPGWPPKIPQ
jgi:hypothetical protein